MERPIVPIEVSNGDTTVRYFGFIDSGADINLFHAEICDLLGMRLEDGVQGYMKGAVEGRSEAYYVHPVGLKIDGKLYETHAAFMPNLSRNGHGLLGQRTFFSLFKRVSFDFENKQIELIEK